MERRISETPAEFTERWLDYRKKYYRLEIDEWETAIEIYNNPMGEEMLRSGGVKKYGVSYWFDIGKESHRVHIVGTNLIDIVEECRNREADLTLQSEKGKKEEKKKGTGLHSI